MTKFIGIEACVFDAYGTLFDVHSAVGEHRARLGGEADAVSGLWRTKQLEYTWQRTILDRYVDFWRVTADGLDFALDACGIDDSALRDDLLHAYLALDCYPEVPGVLRTLKDAGLRTAILSNGSPMMLDAAVGNAGIGDLLDAVLSVDELGLYKPSPEVYELAMDQLEVGRGTGELPVVECVGCGGGGDVRVSRCVVQPVRPGARAAPRRAGRRDRDARRAAGDRAALTEMDIAGHSAVVTGGGSGLGAETARRLAGAGARVAVLDVDAAAAGAVGAEIGGLGLGCDVSEASAVEGAMVRARDAHGPARICVNCAGIAPAQRVIGRGGPAPLDGFRRVVEVNLIGTFNVMRVCAADIAALDPLNETGERGVMIATASVAAYEGQIGQAAYAASKAGLAGMTLPLARDLASLGIRVMSIAPGLMETPMLAGMHEEVRASLAESVPFPRRLGQPGEFADLVEHIIANAMLNGSVIRLDGAIRMQPR